MANFAKLENSITIRVIGVNNADCADGILPQADVVGNKFLTGLGITGEWLLTSIDAVYRKNYAGIGYTYDTARNAFIPPKPPHASWFLDEATCRWIAPVPMPSEGGPWAWDEATVTWVAL